MYVFHVFVLKRHLCKHEKKGREFFLGTSLSPKRNVSMQFDLFFYLNIFNKNTSTTEWVVKLWSWGSSCILGRILNIFKPTQSWQDNPNPKGLPMYPLWLNQRLRVRQLKASQQQIITSPVLFIRLNFCHVNENPSL
jgi:hypothetical protein